MEEAFKEMQIQVANTQTTQAEQQVLLNQLLVELRRIQAVLPKAHPQSTFQQTSGRTETLELDTIQPSHLLQKMTAGEDFEAYLQTFEQIATQSGWPRSQWSKILGPFLTGEALKAYNELENEKYKDYNKMKNEIQSRLRISYALSGQKFNEWKFQVGSSPRSQLFDLWHTARKWLEPETLDKAQIVERVVINRFIQGLPESLRDKVSALDYSSPGELLAKVEHTVTSQAMKNDLQLKKRNTSPKRLLRYSGKIVPRAGVFDERLRVCDGGKHKLSIQDLEKESKSSNSTDCCFRCGEYGHISPHCQLSEEEMDCSLVKRFNTSLAYALRNSQQDRLTSPRVVTVSLSGTLTEALIDTGKDHKITEKSFLPQTTYHKQKPNSYRNSGL
ncbi:uncharacterized protein LOC114658193 [Erpetoichthys calabaricus]|uniref:Uncharacterized LOC114658193 n=1 Tax=Erpetoichthys calabaricus TaxID=27687 RepID=A0A8C4SFU6_ERPCA|nr:uncharacterized protein LOC114658193 [Erpetoichthys calabaricus]